MNQSCQSMLGTTTRDGPRFGFVDATADRLLIGALQGLARPGLPSTQSISVRAREDGAHAVAHVLPVRRSAHDLFAAASAIVVITPLAQDLVPGLSVLEGLFDLTPAEARVARSIAGCRTVEHIAIEVAISQQTVRAQLKAVMAKTGVGRQAELVRLLSGAVLV
ncbi:helix-turn-helix transcriptional regulator [Methylobacterium sp. P31]